MKILVIASHPDDAVIGCGGIITKYVQEGSIVNVIYITSGHIGGNPGKREAEARRAMKVLGVNEENLIFLRFLDQKVSSYEKMISVEMRSQIDRLTPDIIYSPILNEGHIDHKATYEIMRGLKLKNIVGYEVWPGHSFIDRKDCVDITEVMDRKVLALKEFKTQGLDLAECFKALARYRGEFSGVGKYCEVFVKYV